MIVIGLMSGTSLDAIDAAAARFTRDGDVLSMDLLGHIEAPWPTAIRQRLLDALPPAPVTFGEVCALDVAVAEAFADAALQMLRHHPAGLLASHGQTVFHWIEDGRARGTLQLGQPAVIAERTGLPVVSDFRARDVAAGGQGAPLASTLDALWLAGDRPRAALNLGGIANLTVVGPGPVLAFDTGPASCLLDLEAARLSGGTLACDQDGRLAASGTVRPEALLRLLADPYYRQPVPKSTGRERFDRGYVAQALEGLTLEGPDLMATLTALTARTVADACREHGVVEVVASGGGVRNPALMAALRQELGPITLVTAEALGLPSDAKEAYLFALLGYLTWHGLSGTTGATGAAPRVLGRISPGAGPLVLPAPASLPDRLVIRS